MVQRFEEVLFGVVVQRVLHVGHLFKRFSHFLERLTEQAVIAEFFTVHEQTVAEGAFSLWIGGRFGLTTEFGYPFYRGHFGAGRRIRLQKLFGFHLEFFDQLVRNVRFLQNARINFIGLKRSYSSPPPLPPPPVRVKIHEFWNIRTRSYVIKGGHLPFPCPQSPRRVLSPRPRQFSRSCTKNNNTI